MNETLSNITNRRSVRSFAERSLPRETLEQIVAAGIFAPSANNQQPLHFTVITRKELIDSISAGVKDSLRKSDFEWARGFGANDGFHVFYHAPAVILVSMSKTAMMPEVDAAAAIENMLIAAESLGVASCWIGLTTFHFRDTEHNLELGVPFSHRPFYAVALGYPNGAKPAAPARKESANWIE